MRKLIGAATALALTLAAACPPALAQQVPSFNLYGPIPAGSNTIGSIANISGTVSLPTGAATATNQSSEIAALGAPGDAAYAGTGSASMIAAMKGVYAGLAAATPAGSNVIGKVGIDQTTAGTTNGVVVNSSALPAGAATQATLASIAGNTPTIGTQNKAGSQSTTMASDLANLEPAGAAITGAAMPAGGSGLTGWLSAIWSGNVSRNVYSASKTANLAASGLLGTSYLALGASPSPYTSVVSTFYTNATGASYSIEISDGTGSYVVLQTGTLTAGTPLSSKLPASAMNTTGTQYRAYIQNGSNVANSAFVSIALTTN